MEANTLGSRLRSVRKMGNVSRRELSILSDVAQALCSLIERSADPNPKLKTLAAFGGVLGVTVGWLADGSGPPPDPRAVGAAIATARVECAARKAAAAAAQATPDASTEGTQGGGPYHDDPAGSKSDTRPLHVEDSTREEVPPPTDGRPARRAVPKKQRAA